MDNPDKFRSDKKIHYFDQPENINFVLRIFYFICALLILSDWFYHRHVMHAWEGLFGFYAGYGFLACVLLVVVAKQMRKALMRHENYYDREPANDDLG